MEEFSFGLFEDLLEEEPSPLTSNVLEDEEDIKRKLKERKLNIYEPDANGDSRLLRAIRSGKQIEINAMLELYQEDFDKVRDHLVSKYHVEDRIWLRKTIQVASTEEQCQNAKNLENQQVDAEELRRAVLVLLQHPVNDEELAVLYPNEVIRSSVAKLITTLIPNGFLSWNIFDRNGNKETIMQVAASHGLNNVIDRLYEFGLELAVPGFNPLLQAVWFKQKETVQWLLTEHFDHFDCTLRDSSLNNALIAAMQRNDGDLFDLILEKMITYRVKYYNETEEEAFHEIFRLENDENEYTSIFDFMPKSGLIFERVENAIQKYKLKLSHQWENNIILGRLIDCKVALDYCFEGIRNDPGLLGFKAHNTTTILHQLVTEGHLDFVRKMYTKHPEVTTHFNTDQAFEVLRKAINNECRETIQFVLEHHGEFVKGDLDKLRDHAVCCQYYTEEFYESRQELLVECFPELQETIRELMAKAGIEGSFAKMIFDGFDFDKPQKPHSIFRGSNGETLLHLAVDRDDEELFIRMLEAGCEFDALDNDGNHPVHLVKSEEMLDLIINRHPEGRNIIQRTNNDGCTILHKVCQQKIDSQKCVALLEKLIEYGADVHQLTKHGESAVFFAGDHQVLDLLRTHGVQLDSVNDLGETPLERHLCNVWMARPLFSYVHDLPSFKQHAHKYLAPMLNQSGHVYSYDYQVVFEEYPEAARIMLNSVYEQSREEASRLFCKACTTGFVHVVKLFLDGNYDLDFNYKDEYGETPLLGIINVMDQPEVFHIFKRLLEKGVNVHPVDSLGRDALMMLIWRFRNVRWYGNWLETVQLLLDHGSTIQTTDQDGNTPLHLAFADGEMELVEFLVVKGADTNAVNKQGKRPIEVTSAVNRELFYFYS